MMRYRSTRIVPGVNPPAGIESDEIILATWGVSAGLGDSAAGVPIVGIWEGELRGRPQELQKRLSCGFCVEHFGHRIVGVGFIMLRSQFQVHLAQQGAVARVGAQGIEE